MSPAEKAGQALVALKAAVLDYLALHPDGLRNVDLAKALGLRSDFQGRQKDYLSWSVIGLLVNEGKVRVQKKGRGSIYMAIHPS